MTLTLSGQIERMVEPYSPFEGRIINIMPRVISGKDEKEKVVDVPRILISYAGVIDRRETAPEDVRGAWQKNYICTGDADLCNDQGANLITFYTSFLRELNPKTRLHQGAAILSQNQWDELATQREKVLILSAEEVQEAHGKGYIKKDGVWVPANATVGKVWEGTNTFPGLARGRNLVSYIQLVAEHSPHSESLLNVYFNQTKEEGSVTGRLWVARSVDDDSRAGGDNDLYNVSGRLVGVAPEALVAREKVLEARVSAAHIAGRAYELGEHLWVPVPKTAGAKL